MIRKRRKFMFKKCIFAILILTMLISFSNVSLAAEVTNMDKGDFETSKNKFCRYK